MICLENLAYGGTSNQIRKIVDMGLIERIIAILGGDDTRLIFHALQTLDTIFNNNNEDSLRDSNEEGYSYVVQFDRLSGCCRLEKLQYHPDNEIYAIVSRIIEKYFQSTEKI